MAVQEKLYTADDLWELSHQVGDQKRLELVRGVIHEKAPTGDMHMVICANITFYLVQYVKPRKLGIVGGDAAFISKARVPKFTGKYIQFAPDLAVEVMSPNDTPDEIRKKILEYLKAGTQIVWVIYPDSKTVDVGTPSTDEAFSVHVLDINGTLDGADVIPGFALPVSQLFEDLEPPTP
jgi:Uma2 family endonuclease